MLLIHVGLIGAFLLLPPAAAMHVDDPESLGALMPYGPAPASIEPPPAGYRPVFVESLNRHGSRALTSPVNIDNALALWQRASTSGALTPLGERFAADVQALDDANRRMGYGNLSKVGESELRAIGARTARRLPELFSTAGQPLARPGFSFGASVELRSSGAARATDSAQKFAEGLRSVYPELETARPVVDSIQLHFDQTDIAYRAFLNGDRPTLEAIARVARTPGVVRAAKNVLGRLYSPAFVSGIADPVAEARSIYGLYAIGPAMARESDVDFGAYVSAADAAALAYANDARYFYQRGPGIEGRREGFAPAARILDDFFEQADRRLGGGAVAAVFRFAHAEQVIPFAALLELPGSEQQAAPGHVYSRADNPWRGAEVSRLAANIQWIVYGKTDGPPLVAMLYNERQIPFKDGCTPVADDSYLYALAELRRCLR